jgi:hypothetical protein
LGARPLGATRRRLGLGARPLGLTGRRLGYVRGVGGSAAREIKDIPPRHSGSAGVNAYAGRYDPRRRLVSLRRAPGIFAARHPAD